MEVAAPAVCWQRFFFPKHEDNLKIYNSKTVTIWRFCFLADCIFACFLILKKENSIQVNLHNIDCLLQSANIL